MGDSMRSTDSATGLAGDAQVTVLTPWTLAASLT